MDRQGGKGISLLADFLVSVVACTTEPKKNYPFDRTGPSDFFGLSCEGDN